MWVGGLEPLLAGVEEVPTQPLFAAVKEEYLQPTLAVHTQPLSLL